MLVSTLIFDKDEVKLEENYKEDKPDDNGERVSVTVLNYRGSCLQFFTCLCESLLFSSLLSG